MKRIKREIWVVTSWDEFDDPIIVKICATYELAMKYCDRLCKNKEKGASVRKMEMIDNKKKKNGIRKMENNQLKTKPRNSPLRQTPGQSFNRNRNR